MDLLSDKLSALTLSEHTTDEAINDDLLWSQDALESIAAANAHFSLDVT